MKSLISTLCKIAAIYGIVVGIWMLPTALFVGPHILIAALAHIATGILFWVAYANMRRRSKGGIWLCRVLALFCSSLGALAIYQGYGIRDPAFLVFWGSFTLFFVGLAVLAFWPGVEQGQL